ncbi:MAG: chromate efflux transporter [Alphaproteobacteria bacterium]|nr:chromate efflux transporter [Alphaproteobacteria bacterium]
MSQKPTQTAHPKNQLETTNQFPKISFTEMFWVFFKLGLTSFGGPIAHIGYFHKLFVEQKKWFSAEEYAEIVSLCQFLPGPTSSQVGMSIGLKCGGISNAFAAWLGFTIPSMLIMIAAGYGILTFDGTSLTTILHVLKLLAAAVILQAVLSMAKTLTPDWTRRILALTATIILVVNPTALMQLFVLGAGIIAGIFLSGNKSAEIQKTESKSKTYSYASFIQKLGPVSAIIFGILLFALPLLAIAYTSPIIEIANIFFQSGALVFGGGHVVLPLLQSQLVPNGLISHTDFMAGYGMAQAIPGPLFTFAAYLGVMMHTGLPAWISGIVCLIIIFLPAILLVLAVIPFWDSIRGNSYIQAGLYGINAVVVGLLLAALINPILILSLKSGFDIIIILGLFLLLVFSRLPVWLVILGASLAGYAWSFI